MCSIMGYCGEKLPLEEFEKGFEKTKSRGPDMSRVINTGKGFLGFHRLAIMGVDSVKEFAIPLMVGIVCGCYSSICITGTVWYSFKKIGSKKNA